MKSKAIVLAVVVLAVVGWMGLGATSLVGGGSVASPAHASASPSAVPFVSGAPSAPGAVTAPSFVSVGGSNIAANMAAHALAATHAAGLKSNVVFVPRPSASPQQVTQAAQTGTVSPLYNGVPAPIGLAYYGLSGNGKKAPVGTILNTTAVRGTVDANATGIQGMDLFQSSPDSFGIQLNSVMTNVTLFGQGNYSFWTQNVVTYYPASGFMILVTNIWNFSGGGYNGNEFYAHSLSAPGAGDDWGAYGALGYYYAEAFIYAPISYPFNLTLTMNSGINGGRDNMSFSVALTSPTIPSEDFSLPNWDAITFNSTALAEIPSLTVPSNYTANGLHYNAIGLTNDFEIDICGPGGGSQVDLSAADATLGLSYLSGGTFVSVPAAYNYGGETGETASGANVAWSNAPGGPVGIPEYGTMTTGPTVLSGLWGTGAPEGSYPVTIAATPGNAFDLIQYNGTATFVNPVVEELSYAPSMLTDTFYLMPGTYGLVTELANYAPFNQTITVAGPMTVTVPLSLDPALGDYTPLWAFSNAEVAALAQSGLGTPASPYILYNSQLAPISFHFGLYNDYTFPVFPGVFLFNTTATVEIYKPPTFSTMTSHFQYPGEHLPGYNDPQYWFWNASNVAIVDAANISGWFGASAFYPLSFDTFNVIFYEGGHNLVAGNTFDTESQALLMFSGGTLFGPLNVGGGNNTVWGNTFNEVLSPAVCPTGCLGLFPYGYGLAMEIAESNDLVYNNIVQTPTTAWLDPINLYSGDPEFFSQDAWNITPQPAADVNVLVNFPTLPLSGNILGGPTQGGNYWWDYGVVANPYNGADNPLGVLPYDENAFTLILYVYGPYYYYQTYIYGIGTYAGDQDPLTLTGIGPAVTFVEHGLLPGTAWGAAVIVGFVVYGFVTTAGSESLSIFPAGIYHWAALTPYGYSIPHGGTIHLTHPITVAISYHLAPGYAFLTVRESGLPSGTPWSVTINGTTPATDPFNATGTTTGTSQKFLVLDGAYTFTAPNSPGWAASPAAGALSITGMTSLHLRYHPVTYALLFSEDGMTPGKRWGVRVTGPINGLRTSTRTFYTTSPTLSIPLPNGTYTYTVLPPAHTTCTPASGSETISGAGIPVSLTCVVSGGGIPAKNPAPLIFALPSTARPAAVRGPWT